MKQYNVQYRRFIEDKKITHPLKLTRAKFYLITEYIDVDGVDHRYNTLESPIIFALWVSKSKDIIHAVKVSDVRPDLVKRFFGKLVNEEEKEIEIKGPSKIIYEKYVSKNKFIKQNAYRTYKLSGIKKVFELDMDETKITPKNKQARSIDKKSQK